MKSLAILGLVLSGARLGFADSCNADNCARAVTGTFMGLQSTHLADCSSYLQCTTTAPVVIVTLTSSITGVPSTITVTATPAESIVTSAIIAAGTTTITAIPVVETVTVTLEPLTSPVTLVTTAVPTTVTVTAPGFGLPTAPSKVKRSACKRKTSQTTLSTIVRPTSASSYYPSYVNSTTTTTTTTTAKKLSSSTSAISTVSLISPVSNTTTTAGLSTASSITTTVAPIITSSQGVTCPTAIPSYASACSGSARYTSACACAGITRTTTTVGQTTSYTITFTTLPLVRVTSVVTLSAQTSALTVVIPGIPSTVIVTPAPMIVTVTDVPPVQTPTIVATLPGSTVTVTVSQPLPTLCDNAGFQWAYFLDSDDGLHSPSSQDAYDPTTHKTDTPSLFGTTNYLQITDGQIYGQQPRATSYVVEHRGWILAPETGTYNFAASNIDDLTYMWFGPAAYSGWQKGNADQFVAFQTGPSQVSSGQVTKDLVAGNYYPVRVLFKQGSGAAKFSYSITAPSGLVLIGSNQATAAQSPFAVQYSCDGVSAPRYQPFGQET